MRSRLHEKKSFHGVLMRSTIVIWPRFSALETIFGRTLSGKEKHSISKSVCIKLADISAHDLQF